MDRLPSLDGWRAVAIWLVLLSHSWAVEGALAIPSYLSSHGDLGVRIFFVISGFLITYLLIDEHQRTSTISLRNFYIRRAIRLFPAYYLFLMVLAFFSVFSLYDDAASSWLGALTYTRNVVGQGRSATGHLWSLATEEQFYLLWPLTLAVLGLFTRPHLALVLLCIVTAASLTARTFTCLSDTFLCHRILGPKSAFLYADSLAVGCGGAFLYEKVTAIMPTLHRLLRVGLLYGMLAALCASTVLIGPATPTVQAIIILSVVFLSMHERSTILFRVLNSRPLIYFGVISYSLYLWHVLFLTHYIGDRIVFPANDRAWWLYAVGLATLSYICVERPIRAWGRHTLRARQP